jgi:hypothetical protein
MACLFTICKSKRKGCPRMNCSFCSSYEGGLFLFELCLCLDCPTPYQKLDKGPLRRTREFSTKDEP